MLCNAVAFFLGGGGMRLVGEIFFKTFSSLFSTYPFQPGVGQRGKGVIGTRSVECSR